MVVNLGYNGTLHEIELLGEDVTVIVPETSPLLVEVSITEGTWRNTNKVYYKQEDEEAHEMLEANEGEAVSYSIPATYLTSGKVTLALFDTDTEQLTNTVSVMLRKVPVSDPEDDDLVFLLDNSRRRVIVPGSQPILAIQYDSQSEIVEFKFPRWQDGVDLSSKTPYVNYKRPKADDLGKAQCIIDTTKTDQEYVYFYWVVDGYATAFEGILEFQVEFADQYGYRWQSQVGTLPILTSLYNTGLEPYAPTFLEDMLQRMQTVGSDAEAYAVGTRDGEDVPSTDPAYHNNAKYYAEQSSASTWDNIKPPGGIPTSDLQDNTNAEWGLGFGVCTTEQATAAKTVSISGYKLVKDGFVAVRFTNAVNGGATLNINNQGAKVIRHAGADISNRVIRAGETCIFAYDGSYYHLVSLVPSGATVLELTKNGTTIYLGMTFADAYAAFTNPWNTYLLLQIDTGVPLIMRPSKVDSVNYQISIEALAGTTLYTATLSPVVGQAQMSGTLVETSIGGGETFPITVTINGSTATVDRTIAEIIAAVQAGKATSVLIDGTNCGWVGYADTGEVALYCILGYDSLPTLYQVYMSGNTVTVTEYVLNEYENTVIVSGATPTIAAANNQVYSCGEITSLTITDSTQNISFKVDFTSGSTPTVINTPSGYKAPGGDLTAEANKTYELDVRNGKAVLTAFEAVSAS